MWNGARGDAGPSMAPLATAKVPLACAASSTQVSGYLYLVEGQSHFTCYNARYSLVQSKDAIHVCMVEPENGIEC